MGRIVVKRDQGREVAAAASLDAAGPAGVEKLFRESFRDAALPGQGYFRCAGARPDPAIATKFLVPLGWYIGQVGEK